MNRVLRSRRGFALLGVLAVLGFVSVMVLSTMSDARLAVRAVAHRTNGARLEWEARGCLARARAELDEALRAADPDLGRALIWRDLKQVLDEEEDLRRAGCALESEPVGLRADANALDSLSLLRLFEEVTAEVDAEMLVASLLDWRDPDDIARAGGAEGDWYLARNRYGPSNRTIETDEELALIRGFDEQPGALRLLTTQGGPISLSHAPREVLVAVAGADPLVLAHLLEARQRAGPHSTLRNLLESADTSLSRRAAAQYATLEARLVVAPEAWLLTAQARDDATGLVVRMEQRLRRSAQSVFVVSEVRR